MNPLLYSSGQPFNPGGRILYKRTTGGFSLIEVALALGILAFSMVAIIGLVSGSLSTKRKSAEDFALTQITRNVTEDLRGRPMDDLITSLPETRYFYLEGGPCEATSDTAARQKGAIYRCQVSGTVDTSTQSADGTVNLLNLKMSISWPLGAGSSGGPNQKDVHVNVARY